MFIETYQVEDLDGKKAIHYNGFTWARPDAEDGKPYAATEGTWVYVEVGPNNFERAMLEFERNTQYVYELTEEELLEYEDEWKKRGTRLNMDDVTESTPCGMYWFPRR